MRNKIIVKIILLLITINVQAQQEEKAVQIGVYSLKLNSSVLGTFLKPLDAIKIDLPKNTKSWFYVFNAKLNDTNTDIFKSISSTVIRSTALASNLYTMGGSSSLMPLIISKISIPTGDAAVSVYCLDESNKVAFLNKKDFTPLPFGMAEEQKEGKIIINELNERNIYLGIKNTSKFQRVVYVTIQVFAITEENKPESEYTTNGWNIDNKRKMFNRWTNESVKLGYSQEKANEVAKCTQMSILSKYSFEDYQKMGKEKWNQTVIDLFNKCSIK